MPVDESLVGREFPPTSPYTVTAGKVSEFAAAAGGHYDGSGPAPATFPIVLAFEAMNAFLAAEQIDLFRIVHGEQQFAYERPVVPGDVLTVKLAVQSLRRVGSADIIGTRSQIRDSAGHLVCSAKATLVHSPGDAG